MALENYITMFSCGCRVIFFAEADWKTSQMDCCAKHRPRIYAKLRDAMMDKAREQLNDELGRKLPTH